METTLLIFHIVTGTVSVLAGFVALCTTKGSPIHRKAGKAFFYTMIPMAFSGFVLAALDAFVITALAGLFTCYLVFTAWTIIKVRPNTVNNLDKAAPVLALILFGLFTYYGLVAMDSADGTLDGIPFGYYFFFSTVTFIAGVMDIRMLVAKGLSGANRLARHLWRMCFAFYLSLGSFLERSVNLIPKDIYESGVLELPIMFVMLAMLFYLGKVYFQQWKRKRRAASQAA